MRIRQVVTQSKEMIERWINQHMLAGKPHEELDGTLFVYGNEVHSLRKSSSGDWMIEPHEASQVIVFRKEDDTETEPVNMCRACGLDYSSYKEAIQCCAYLD
jgi:hypothetical protein